MADLGRVELFTGVEVPLPTEQTTPTGTVSLFDVPVRAGGRLTFGATRLVTAVGFFAAAHVLSASSTSSAGGKGLGPDGGRRGWAGGAGAGTDALAIFLGDSGWAEALVPRTWFVEGKPVIETGRYSVGLGLGVALPTR